MSMAPRQSRLDPKRSSNRTVPPSFSFGAVRPALGWLLDRTARSTPNTQFAQDDLRRAEVREGRLQEVKADKGGEPEPMENMVMSQDQTKQDKTPGHHPDD